MVDEDATEDLRNWMLAGGQTVHHQPTVDISDTDRVLRARLVLEEVMEFVEAMGCDVDFSNKIGVVDAGRAVDLVEAADAMVDIMVVTVGSSHTLGVNLGPCWQEVMQTNWAKFPNGEVLHDETGKITKPEGWLPPDLAPILERQMRGATQIGR